MGLPKRKPNRLINYNYSENGAYFITICIKNRHNLLWDNVGATFGRPSDNIYALSKYGLILENEIQRVNEIYNSAVLVDKYVIMPNHIHIIIILNNYDTFNGRPKVAPTISRIVQQFKGSVTKQIGFPIFQKLFHDHIIRDEQDYHKIWQYINENPLKWEQDCFYSEV